ncbi:hypothetical protein C0J52_15548 [Blattella germanica]|nr:hypothetical protein C0J52_15548 [Blattella germanica]
MPFVYTHIEYADMIYVYGFCDENAENAVAEYRKRFPTRRTPSSRVFVRAFQSVMNYTTLFNFAMKHNFQVMEFSIPIIRMFGQAKILMKL